MVQRISPFHIFPYFISCSLLKPVIITPVKRQFYSYDLLSQAPYSTYISAYYSIPLNIFLL